MALMVTATISALLLLQPHQGGTTAIDVNRNQLVISGGWDSLVRSWEFSAGGVRSFRAGRSQVTDLAFSPDGRSFAATWGDGRVAVFPVGSSTARWSKNSGTSFASGVGFLPNGDVVTSGYDNLLKRWSGSRGTQLRIYRGLPSDAYRMATDPKGRLVAGGGPGGLVVWDAATGRQVSSVRREDLSIGGLKFSPDGTILYAQQLGGSVEVLEARTAKRRALLEGQVWAMDLSWDGKFIATGGIDGEVAIYDSGTLQKIVENVLPDKPYINALRFSSDGQQLLVGTASGELIRVNTSDLIRSHTYTLGG
ncbi:MAG: hypothetical protein MUC92_02980 [Fimbriimonadaceae bacterium]|nr:hypothetical protein [Fimbriimonadaceae bacterium]